MTKDTVPYKTTADIDVSQSVIDQVIGQDDAVHVIKKAALQRRHVLLIGEPGTGKSMLGVALAQSLPKEKLVDVLSFPNPNDENNPLIRVVPAGKGRLLATKARAEASTSSRSQTLLLLVILLIISLIPWWAWRQEWISDVIYAASLIASMLFLVGFIIMLNLGRRMQQTKANVPKVIVDNFGKKQAPFFDATGSIAGALLGDVLHDPFQCFLDPDIYVGDDKTAHKRVPMRTALDKYWGAPYIHKQSSEEHKYEAVFFPQGELSVLAEHNGKVTAVEALSANRHNYDGDMIRITTTTGTVLTVTPNHKVAVQRQGRTVYIPAEQLTKNDTVFSVQDNIIIDEHDIIGSYDQKQQKQCQLYYDFCALKQKHPGWGYKKLAKNLAVDEHKVRWWHEGKHLPVPVQTAMWLKQKSLLPLTYDHPQLPTIAKIMGATFGDGGIFGNLNSLFLSNKEKANVEEFAKDISTVFAVPNNQNGRIIEGGQYGHSFCYQTTNRKIIRFFLALGSPKGKKTTSALIIPSWIYTGKHLQTEFFGSLFGSEMGVPKPNTTGKKLNTFDIAVTGTDEHKQNRIIFLDAIKRYLHTCGVESGTIMTRPVSYTGNNKNHEATTLYRVCLSTKFSSMVRFVKSCKINYCQYKKDKLTATVNAFRQTKKEQYALLTTRGYGAEHAMKVLQLTPQDLYEILNETTFNVRDTEVAYA